MSDDGVVPLSCDRVRGGRDPFLYEQSPEQFNNSRAARELLATFICTIIAGSLAAVKTYVPGGAQSWLRVAASGTTDVAPRKLQPRRSPNEIHT